MMKTVLPTAHPSADPLIKTVCPRLTDDGISVSEGTAAVAIAAMENAAASAATQKSTRSMTIVPPRLTRLILRYDPAGSVAQSFCCRYARIFVGRLLGRLEIRADPRVVRQR